MDKQSDNPNLARDVEALLEQFDQSEWAEMELEIDGLHLYVSRDGNGQPRFGRTAASGGQAAAATSSPPAAARPSAKPAAAKPAAVSAASAADASAEIPEGMEVIRASNVGTFYRSPKPGEAPYVDVGDTVTPDTEVCLIEVMKLFSPLTAGVAGTIAEVLIEDAQMVEYDQPIFLVDPSQD